MKAERYFRLYAETLRRGVLGMPILLTSTAPSDSRSLSINRRKAMYSSTVSIMSRANKTASVSLLAEGECHSGGLSEGFNGAFHDNRNRELVSDGPFIASLSAQL